jgi:dTDP-4-amino-4,6-dideoxygalactose transaminase
VNWLNLVSIWMDESEQAQVAEVLNSRWLSMGPKVAEFEQRFASLAGCEQAISASSCTAATQILLRAMDLEPGDEVITTPFTWPSAAAAIIYGQGAPVFADIDPETFNLSAATIGQRLTPRTRGTVLVHYAGLICPMPEIMALGDKHGLFVIEDAAHAVGSTLLGRHAGSWGTAGCFSFGSTKTITTGEGGMITTSDEQLAARCRMLRGSGENMTSFEKRKNRRYDSDLLEISYNYKLNEIAAAVGIGQLLKLPAISAARRERMEWFREALAPLAPHVLLQRIDPRCDDPVPYIFPLCINGDRATRDTLLRLLREQGIEAGSHYKLAYRQTAYRKALGDLEGSCPVAERVTDTIITLPCHQEVTRAHVETIGTVLRTLIG